VIRPARPDDIDQIAVLGERFISESHYRRLIGINPKALRSVAEMLIAKDHGLLLVDEFYGELAGMIGMIATIHPTSWEPVASELFWYVPPEARGGGLKLLFAAERWAREFGCARCIMIAPNERVSALYIRLGYDELETQFIKDLTT
jgi:GNAT superfamily N-acetyltransferase